MSLSYLQQDTPKSNLDIRCHDAIIDNNLIAAKINGLESRKAAGALKGASGTGKDTLHFLTDSWVAPLSYFTQPNDSWIVIPWTGYYYIHFQGTTEVGTAMNDNLSIAVKQDGTTVYLYSTNVVVDDEKNISFGVLLLLLGTETISFVQSGPLGVKADADDEFQVSMYSV